MIESDFLVSLIFNRCLEFHSDNKDSEDAYMLTHDTLRIYNFPFKIITQHIFKNKPHTFFLLENKIDTLIIHRSCDSIILYHDEFISRIDDRNNFLK